MKKTLYGYTPDDEGSGYETNPGEANELHRMFEQAVLKGVAIYVRTNDPSKEVTPRAAIYVRTATTQEATYHHGLTAQIEACQAYCNARGYIVQHIYQDEGVSGSSLDHRPGLGTLLDAQDIDVVVVYDYNRISLNVELVATFLNHLEAKHIRVETVCYGNDPADFALALIELGRQMERKKFVERMKRHKAAKKTRK